MSARAAGQARTERAVKPKGGKRAKPRSAAPQAPVSTRARRAQRAYRLGRVGIFAIPILAALAVAGQISTAAFTSNRAAYAHYLSHQRFTWLEIAITFGTGFFGLIALAGLTALLLSGRARWIAVTGFVVGIVGAVAMLATVTTIIVRATRVAGPLVHWRLSDVVINANARGSGAAVIVIGGAALLTLGWILLGIAVARTYGLSRGDGALIALSAPMIYLGGFFLNALPTVGAFLLAAASLGVALVAGRLAPARQWVRAPERATRPISPFARLHDEDGDADGGAEDGAEGDQVDEGPVAVEEEFDEQPAGATPVPAAVPDAARERNFAGVSSRGGTPAHANRGSLARLSRGISTAWPVTRGRRNAARATPSRVEAKAQTGLVEVAAPGRAQAAATGAGTSATSERGGSEGTWVKDNSGGGASVKAVPGVTQGPDKAANTKKSSKDKRDNAPATGDSGTKKKHRLGRNKPDSMKGSGAGQE